MNHYQHTFIAECPNNGVKILYTLMITTPDKVMVETIVEKCNVGTCFHEDLADALHEWFGGRQILIAYHHGVWIKTVRGDA